MKKASQNREQQKKKKRLKQHSTALLTTYLLSIEIPGDLWFGNAFNFALDCCILILFSRLNIGISFKGYWNYMGIGMVSLRCKIYSNVIKIGYRKLSYGKISTQIHRHQQHSSICHGLDY